MRGLAILAVAAGLGLAGCTNPDGTVSAARTGGLFGSVTGIIVGHNIDPEIGGAVGGIVGGATGSEVGRRMDRAARGG